MTDDPELDEAESPPSPPAPGPPLILGDAHPMDEIDPWLNLGIYGSPGVGKTYLVGQIADIPGVERVLYMDINGGWVTIRHKKNIHQLQITSWEQFGKVYYDLRRMCHAPEAWPGPFYQAVIIDHVTELQKIRLREEGLETKPNWMLNQSKMETTLTLYKELPLHTIFVFHERGRVDKQTGLEKNCPELPGKLGIAVAGMLDILGYYENRRELIDDEWVTRRVLHVEGTQDYMAKDRTGLLGTEIVNPTMGDIVGPLLAEYSATKLVTV